MKTLKSKMILLQIFAYLTLLLVSIAFNASILRQKTYSTIQNDNILQAQSLRDQYAAFLSIQGRLIENESSDLKSQYSLYANETDAYKKDIKLLDMRLKLNIYTQDNIAYASSALYASDAAVIAGKDFGMTDPNALFDIISQENTVIYPACAAFYEMFDTPDVAKYLPIAFRNGAIIHINFIDAAKSLQANNLRHDIYIIQNDYRYCVRNSTATPHIPDTLGASYINGVFTYGAAMESGHRFVAVMDMNFINRRFAVHLIYLVLMALLGLVVTTASSIAFSDKIMKPVSKLAAAVTDVQGFATIDPDLIGKDRLPKRFQGRVSLFFLMMLLIPFAVFNGATMCLIPPTVRACAEYSLRSSFDITVSSVEYQLKNLQNSANKLAVSRPVQNYLYKINGYEHFDDMNGFLEADEFLSSNETLLSNLYHIGKTSQAINNITIFDVDGQALKSLYPVLDTNLTVPATTDVLKRTEKNYEFIKPVLSICPVRPIGSAQSGTRFQPIGYIKLTILPTSITDNYRDISDSAYTDAYITDANADVISLSVDTDLPRNDKSIFKFTTSLTYTDNWSFVITTSKKLIDQHVSAVLVFLFAIIMALALLVLPFSRLLTRIISRNFIKLADAIVTADSVGSRVITTSGAGEINVVISAFNDMMGRLEDTNRLLLQQKLENRHLETAYKEAELISYQTQLDPHFLHNVFASVNILIGQGKIDDARRMNTNLAKMFKVSIYRNVRVVPIAEETEHLNAYLEIQNVRFKDRINVDVQIEPSLMNLKILKFTLQPLVENAFKHGIEPRGHGEIRINGVRSASLLIFTITDNGIGMAPERLDHVRSSIDLCDMRVGIGLANLQKRIHLHYGTQYGLSIDSVQNRETVVTLKIPVQDEN